MNKKKTTCLLKNFRLFDIRQKGQQHTMLVDLRRKPNSTIKKSVGVDSISINPLNPNYFVIGGGVSIDKMINSLMK